MSATVATTQSQLKKYLRDFNNFLKYLKNETQRTYIQGVRIWCAKNICKYRVITLSVLHID